MFGLRTRGLKILRDIWSRKVRTLLVSTSIFIGVFGVVTLFSAGEILINQLEKDIQQDKLAMIRMQVKVNRGALDDPSLDLTDLSVLRDTATLPGITNVEGRAVYPLEWKLADDSLFRKGTIIAHVTPLGEGQLEPVRLIDGAFPVAGQQQVAIERRMADAYGLDVNDTIELRILSDGAAGSGTNGVVTEPWTISGILFQPYGEIGSLGPVDPEVSVFAAYEDARHIAGFAGLNIIYARYTNFGTAEDEQNLFQQTVGSATPYIPVFTITEDPAQNNQIESTRTTNGVLVLLAMIALIVSGFLVVNVVNSIVVEQKRQIGVMKSLGARRIDSFFIYSGIALMYGVIGVIPGVLLGIPGGYFAAQGLASQSSTVLEGFSVSPVGIILGIIVGLAVPFLASVLPVFNGTRVSILDAMTDVGISSSYGKGAISRLIAAIPMPITLRQAVNNVNQKKFRLALTGTTLTIAVGAFMGIFAVFSSLTGIVDDTFDAFGSQIAINPTEDQDFETINTLLTSSEFTARLEDKGLSALQAIEPGTNLAIEIEGYDPPPITAGPPGLFAIGVNADNPDLLNLTFESGGTWSEAGNPRGAILSERIATLSGWEVGDDIVIRAGGNRDQFEIIGIAQYPFDTVWMTWDTLARLGGLVTNAPDPHSYAMGLAGVTVEGYTGSLDGQTGILGMNIGLQDDLQFLLGPGGSELVAEGRLFTAGEPEVIISQQMAANGPDTCPGGSAGDCPYQLGDTLMLSFQGSEPTAFTIVGIFTLPERATEVNPDHPQDVIGIYWQELATLEGRDFRGEPYPNTFDIILADNNPSAGEVGKVIDEINETLLSSGITAEYTNWVEFNETITGFITLFGVILNMAAALIAAVGAVGLLTSLSMSVFERQKEIGVMRSVGASSYTVAVQFLVEGITVGVAAWVVGIPLSYLISRGLVAALPFGNVFDIGFPPITLVVGLIGMLVVVTIASLWPSLGAARKTVSDILRYQ